MEEDLVSIKWNHHNATFLHILSTLRSKSIYTDVTLSCEGKFLPAHKFILSSCSDYFQEIFEKTVCLSPVIIMRDVKMSELEALIDFMYLGEVAVKESEVDSLIMVAKYLQIKGLGVSDMVKPELTDKSSVITPENPELLPSFPSTKRKSNSNRHRPVKRKFNAWDAATNDLLFFDSKNKRTKNEKVERSNKSKGHPFPLLSNGLNDMQTSRKANQLLQVKSRSIRKNRFCGVSVKRAVPRIRVTVLPKVGKQIDLMSLPMIGTAIEKAVNLPDYIDAIDDNNEEDNKFLQFNLMPNEEMDSFQDVINQSQEKIKYKDEAANLISLPYNDPIILEPVHTKVPISNKPPDNEVAVSNKPTDNEVAGSNKSPDNEVYGGNKPPNIEVASDNEFPNNGVADGNEPHDNEVAGGNEPPNNGVAGDNEVASGNESPNNEVALGNKPPDNEVADVKTVHNPDHKTPGSANDFSKNVQNNEELKLPIFSDKIQPYLFGWKVSKNHGDELRSCLVNELCLHFRSQINVSSIARRKFYNSLEKRILVQYPQIIRDTKMPARGPMGDIFVGMAKKWREMRTEDKS